MPPSVVQVVEQTKRTLAMVRAELSCHLKVQVEKAGPEAKFLCRRRPGLRSSSAAPLGRLLSPLAVQTAVVLPSLASSGSAVTWQRRLKAVRSTLRLEQALRGWKRLAPGFSRLPLPSVVVAGVAMLMLSVGLWVEAKRVLNSVIFYLSQGEWVRLRVRSLMTPLSAVGPGHQLSTLIMYVQENEFSRPSKIGVVDEWLLLELDKYQYQLRHSGPSISLADQSRDLMGLQRRPLERRLQPLPLRERNTGHQAHSRLAGQRAFIRGARGGRAPRDARRTASSFNPERPLTMSVS